MKKMTDNEFRAWVWRGLLLSCLLLSCLLFWTALIAACINI